jgi:lipoate-protein ligase B
VSTLSATALGATPYAAGLRLQEALVRSRVAARVAGVEDGDWLLFPDHPPVLTVGRSPSPGNLRAGPEALAARGIEIHEVARGGDITWHGPGQLIGYPIVDLTARGRDLHRYLRDIEESLIRALAAFSIAAARDPGRTGVWVGGEKIASIGVAVRQWVGYHGFALNVQPDLEFFKLIHPCGLHGIQMTSIAKLLGTEGPRFEEVRVAVARAFADTFGYGEVRWTDPETAWVTAGETRPKATEAAHPHAA